MKYVWSAAGLVMVALPILTTENAVKRDGRFATSIDVCMCVLDNPNKYGGAFVYAFDFV